jgi:hypothetical protein
VESVAKAGFPLRVIGEAEVFPDARAGFGGPLDLVGFSKLGGEGDLYGPPDGERFD